MKHMNNSQFSLASRKQFADLLSNEYDLRSHAKSRFKEKRDQLRRTLENELVEKRGVSKVLARLVAATDKVREIERELSQLGYQHRYDNELCMAGDIGASIKRTIEERMDKEIGTFEDIDARFDSIQLAMMTVETLEDAEKLLKSVSEI